MTKTYQKYKTRITIIAVMIILSWAGLFLRLFQVQVLNGHTYQKTVLKQSQKMIVLPSIRGNIYDCNEKPLTRNLIHYTISANPENIIKKRELSKQLSDFTGKSIEIYFEKLKSKKKFIYLERNLKKNPFEKINPSDFKGLSINRNYRRYYPHDKIAAQILGYTNFDEIGISGIEKDFNKYLTGESGWTYKTKGWSGKIQSKNGMPSKPPINGYNIQLTINLDYQCILEDELSKRQIETNSVSATGLIINPQNGEILAIASTPGFNNNNFSSSDTKYHRIRSITDQFEPGSTFKSFAAVSALLKNKIDINEEFNCENGEFLYYDIPIRDHEQDGMLTLPQIIHKSSNIGIVKIAEKIGPISLYKTSQNFGFGSKTGISLKGESKGKLSPIKNWSAVSLGQIAMGHEVGVTALQLAMAYSAIANGGFLLKPRIIKQIIDNNENIIYEEKTKIIRKVSDENTMNTIRKMLRGVVSKGTGHNAEISGWEIAGKTGTAQKFKNGKYSNNQFISNFIGFFPYDDPQLLTYIMLDEPEMPYHWGAEGAAIAFNRILKRIISMDDEIIPPQKNSKFTSNNNKEKKIDVIANNKTNNYEQKNPISLSTNEILYTKVKMPELRGLSLRKAISTLNFFKIKYKINGSGAVFWQSPEPGNLILKGSTCILGLK